MHFVVQTYVKRSRQIGRLKKLVGRKGFSNNPAAEISDVMKLFEEDMAGLQRDIASLQRCGCGVGVIPGGPPLVVRAMFWLYGREISGRIASKRAKRGCRRLSLLVFSLQLRSAAMT